MVKVVVADQNDSFRLALVELLEKQKGIQVADQAKSGREAILLSYSLHPHALLLDHSITGTSGLDIVREIRMVSPNTKIILLTFDDVETSRSLKEVLAVDGCISKSNVKQDLLKALKNLQRQLAKGSEQSGRGN